MNRTVLFSILLVGGLNCSVQGAPLLYTDYITALEAPISNELQQYVRDGTPPERVMNILFKQSQRVTPESSSIFLENIHFLLPKIEYAKYQASLHQLNIQTLMLNGDIEAGVEAITNLSPKEQAPYCLLLATALLQLNLPSKAVEAFNALSPEVYHANKEQVFNAAQDMVVNHGILSHTLHFPENGDEVFALQLADFYERSGLYSDSLSERIRRLSFIKEPSDQQAYRQTLVDFAKDHHLVNDERRLMEDYLASAVIGNEVIGEEENVNEYSRLLVHYYFDKRNQAQQSRWSDYWLEAQRLLGEESPATQQAYLKNRLYRFNNSRFNSFYSDVVKLAMLTQDRTIIVNEYSPYLSVPIQKMLLDGFFTLPLKADDTTTLMADAQATLLEQCDEKTPMEVRALKGHQLMSNDQLDIAHQCFSSVVWEQVSLPENILASLSNEQNQVDYFVMKQSRNISAMIAIAQLGGASMRLDALSFAVDAEPLTPERLKTLSEISSILELTSKQKISIDAQINERLRDEKQFKLLLPRLEQSPETNALELAYWFMSQDQIEKAADYLLIYLGQSTAPPEVDEVRVVRYLDSVFSYLSLDTQQRIRQVSHDSIQVMLKLRTQEASLSAAFDIKDMDMMSTIQQAIAQYNQLKASLTAASVPVANMSAQLWVLGQLEWQFGQFLSQQAAEAPTELKVLLSEQAKQRHTQSKRYARQIIEQKIEGVIDTRVLDAVFFVEEN